MNRFTFPVQFIAADPEHAERIQASITEALDDLVRDEFLLPYGPFCAGPVADLGPASQPTLH